MLFYWGRRRKNRARILAIREEAPTALEALAQAFTDQKILDDGTVAGRLRAVLAATEHRYVPGLHTGAKIGLSGFREEFQDPWEKSQDQAGHFLTAARFGSDPSFLSNPVFLFLLGGLGDDDIALRLMIGHEKAPDPANVDLPTPRNVIRVLRHFRAQYRAVTEEDLARFRGGDLEKIQVGAGLGNSLADLRLSYKGWAFGRQVADGGFQTRGEMADWVRRELG